MRILRSLFIILLIIIVVIQFFRPEKNIHAGPFKSDISTKYPVPHDVDTILAHACYDCHSNNTRYPWYNNIQPVAWWLQSHVNDGKRGFNFNEFAGYSPRKQYDRMDGTIQLVKKGEMPLDSYTWIHKDAILSDSQKNTLFAWANSVMDTLKAHYPPDSLAKRHGPPPAGK